MSTVYDRSFEEMLERARAEGRRRGFEYVVGPGGDLYLYDGRVLKPGDEVKLSDFEGGSKPATAIRYTLMQCHRVLDVHGR